MKAEISQQIFEKYSNTKFHENPFRGSRVVSCGQTDGHDMKKPTVAFRYSANSPKNIHSLNTEESHKLRNLQASRLQKPSPIKFRAIS